jgi:hypothetical protein
MKGSPMYHLNDYRLWLRVYSALAKEQEWLNISGRGAGKPNMQKAIVEAVKAGILSMNKTDKK